MAKLTKTTQQIVNMFEEARKGYEYIKGDLIVLERAFMNIIPEDKFLELKRRGKSIILPKKIYAKVRRMLISVMKTYFENPEFAKLTPICDKKGRINLNFFAIPSQLFASGTYLLYPAKSSSAPSPFRITFTYFLAS
jgi:hypothetical protein